jgi:hypothetical protein
MVSPLINAGRRPGPASQTFYPEVFSSENVESSRAFREELSCAFSTTYLLKPHAIVRSYFDQRSIWDYKDPEINRNLAHLYPADFSPGMDLRKSLYSVYQARLLYQRENSLQP